jgi:hypothetical protein
VALVFILPMADTGVIEVAMQKTGVQQSLFLRFAWV